MIVLCFDTALDACSACLLDGDVVVAARSEPMPRGHQERLAPLVDELMAEAGLAFSALDRIGVTVGPGSFTGLRVGMAFAKGLGFALGKSVAGIGTLEALAASNPSKGLKAAVIDARRDQVYVQAFWGATAASYPEALSVADAAELLIKLDPSGPAALIGSGGPLLAEAFPKAALDRRSGADPVALARLVAAAVEPSGPPAPLYLRAPDAKLPT